MPVLFDLRDIEAALPIVRGVVPPTPQYAWPLLKAATGVEVVVKHENHTPTGAFKLRGGLVYVDRLKRARPNLAGIVSATTGNHGQSLAFAGQRLGLAVTIVAPLGNSPEKNAAMRAFGAELIEHGRDFDEAKDHAAAIAAERALAFAPSYHRDLVVGRVVPTNSALTFAEGVAVRVPDPQALDIIRGGAARIVEVSEDEIAEAIRVMFSAPHSPAEGAGAVALAALIKERERLKGRRAAVILSGQNFDRRMAQTVLNGGTPRIETTEDRGQTTDR